MTGLMGDTESREAGEPGLQGGGREVSTQGVNTHTHCHTHTVTHPHARTHTAVSDLQGALGLRYLTGAGVGPLTWRTGEGDCCRPPVALDRKEGGDLEVGLGGTRGGVL